MTDTPPDRDVSPSSDADESRQSGRDAQPSELFSTSSSHRAATQAVATSSGTSMATVSMTTQTTAATTTADLSPVSTRRVTPYDSDGNFQPATAVENMAAVLDTPAESGIIDSAGREIYGLADLDDCDHAEGREGDTFVHKPNPRRAHKSNYCSGRCEYRALAESVVDTMTYDHRFCASCFKRQKTITGPRQETEWGGTTNGRYLSDQDVTKEAFVGRAYGTPASKLAVSAKSNGEETNTAPAEYPPNNQVHKQRRACECGVTHHTQRKWPLTKDDALDAARNLATSLSDVRDELLAGSGAEAERARRWDFSDDLLLYATGKLKTEPRRQFNERRIFISALATALRYPEQTV